MDEIDELSRKVEDLRSYIGGEDFNALSEDERYAVNEEYGRIAAELDALRSKAEGD